MRDIRITDVLIFDGLGTVASHSTEVTDIALQDADTAIGNILLSALHRAFLCEYETLTDVERLSVGIDLEDFQQPRSLLDIPMSLNHKALLAIITLYTRQLLRLAANVDVATLGGQILRTSAPQFAAGPLGFSTGMLSATVAATSYDIPSFLSISVQIFRLAFWLGLRSQEYASSALEDVPVVSMAPSWSLVIFGSSPIDVRNSVQAFNDQNPIACVHLTAITSPDCVTVSGRPDTLWMYKSSFVPSTAISSQFIPVYSLYHAPELLTVKQQVLEDVKRRAIMLPLHGDLRRPLRSSVDGHLLHRDTGTSEETLAEAILDMILIFPVKFDVVLRSLLADFSSLGKQSISLINVGPSVGLWRSVSRQLRGLNIQQLDWSQLADRRLLPSSIQPYVRPQEPIAIVGMAVNFPCAGNTNELWDILRNGLNTVSEIPSSRFDVEGYSHESNRHLKTKFGNFLRHADVFDNAFFRVSPREARSMDPQQRVLLHVAYHALENAGYVPNATPAYNPDTFATYVGASTNDYVQNLRDDIDVYYSTGTLQAFLSGKISYTFGFGGPSIVVDTACSSSIVAIHQACRALERGDCTAALAGGVHVVTSPDMYIGLDRAHFLSPTGQCRPWDASADGYCRAEGCGMFVLKRLSDALAENDRILGVIRGAEINQSGNAESITHPHVDTQTKLFRKLLASTNTHPHEVSVVEAHGTGTQVGDPAELQSLRAVFAVDRAADNPLHITSVKANIGHAEAASGAASLAKVLLMMRERAIPPLISLRQLNPNIADFGLDGTRIDTQLTAWEAPSCIRKRLALVNNFGAAGSNAALLMEEAPLAQSRSTDSRHTEAFVVGLSCETAEATERLREAYIKELVSLGAASGALADFAYTATARRQMYRFRIAASGASARELCAGLRNAPVVETKREPSKAIFVFSGQGGQYLGMGSGLYRTVVSFRKIVDQCHAKLVSWGFPGVLNIIAPSSGSDIDITESAHLEATQCAVYVLEYALALLWTSWGIQPAAVIGHSLGEYAALVLASVLSWEDALWLVANRARLMRTRCAPGTTGMLAVAIGADALTDILQDNDALSQLSVACYNSETDCVVAGDLSRLHTLKDLCERAGHRCTRLSVPYGYHSSAMDPVVEGLQLLGEQVHLSPPSIPVLSGAYGAIIREGSHHIRPEYFSDHCRNPVQFQRCVQALRDHPDLSGSSAWLEIGPHPTTLSMLHIQSRVPLVPTLHKRLPDLEAICSSLAKMYTTSLPVDWRKVFDDVNPGARVVDLPSYPLMGNRFWVPYSETRSSSSKEETRTQHFPTLSLLPDQTCTVPNQGAAIYEVDTKKLSYLLEGHQVAGFALCSASVYHELALTAAHSFWADAGTSALDTVLELSDLVYEKAFVCTPCTLAATTMRIEIAPSPYAEGFRAQFKVTSLSWDASEPTCHCSGIVSTKLKQECASELDLRSSELQLRRQTLSIGSPRTRTIYAQTIYDIFARVVEYSDIYRSMKMATLNSSNTAVYAVVQAPAQPSDEHSVRVIFMDTLLHVAGFLLNHNAAEDDAFICSQLGQVTTREDPISPCAMYGVLCNVTETFSSLAIVDVYAIELDGIEGAVVARMCGIQFRKLKLGAFRGYLSSLMQQSLYGDDAVPSSSTSEPSSIPSSDYKRQLVSGVTSSLRVDINAGTNPPIRIELTNQLPNVFPILKLDSATSYEQQGSRQLTRGPQHRSENSSQGAESTVVDRFSVARQVKDILAATLYVPVCDISDSAELQFLGLDSLTSIEARHAFQTSLNVQVPQATLTRCTTVQELVESIMALALGTPPGNERPVAITNSVRSNNPVLLQDSARTGIAPLFLIHDGSGTIQPYSRLQSLNRRVWGIYNPRLETGQQWEGGVVAMAIDYARCITAVNGTRACIVGGWSFGGVVAFEVARQLVRQGVEVSGLILIDSPHPRMRSPLPPSLIESAIRLKVASEQHSRLLCNQMRFSGEALAAYDPAASPVHDILAPRAIMLRSKDPYPVADVDLELASFLGDRSDRSRSVVHWEELLGAEVPVLDIPGNHFDPFEPDNVTIVSEKLIEALTILQL